MEGNSKGATETSRTSLTEAKATDEKAIFADRLATEIADVLFPNDASHPALQFNF